ncbi:MAG: PEP-CTERM sorting domain-containing protein, partial [Pirellulales bacterium]|nr:PEP-CTERM sorting domain-containing protein [Pirellulales bacterium]
KKKTKDGKRKKKALQVGGVSMFGGVDLFGDVLGALGQVGVGTTWDDGDFDSSGGVDLFGDVLGALGTVGQSTASPAAASAVPEPTSIALLSLAAVSMLGLRRHSK